MATDTATPPSRARALADRIQEHLLGEGDHDAAQLLREACTELRELEWAVNMLMETVNRTPQSTTPRNPEP